MRKICVSYKCFRRLLQYSVSNYHTIVKETRKKFIITSVIRVLKYFHKNNSKRRRELYNELSTTFNAHFGHLNAEEGVRNDHILFIQENKNKLQSQL